MYSVSLCAVFYYWIAQTVLMYATVPGQILHLYAEKVKVKRKKEERIKCKHWSFTLYVCASDENKDISAWGLV